MIPARKTRFNSAATSPSRKTYWLAVYPPVFWLLQFGRDVTVAEDPTSWEMRSFRLV